jgi:TM2 domain-containing membrane protein YozV
VVVVENETGGGSTIAAVASFFIPGLGQLAQGRLAAAIGHFFTAMFLWFILLGWIVHLASAVNAANYRAGGPKKHRSFRVS